MGARRIVDDRQDPDAPSDAFDDATIVALADALLGLRIPPECLPGVRANLIALAGHRDRIEGARA